ncbi:MAG: hypothetical protein OXI22_20795 [Defluviicoccus sp.]|nr:hypothetical protein [Defluviicoccus sp.]MDE0386332.1 hypothetical protein [Defluviicoccus sp.]
MTGRIAVLGWGSLLWDKDGEFDNRRRRWQYDGPTLKLEFSRISEKRRGALTLVIDSENGMDAQVAWALSRRDRIGDAAEDLRKREKAHRKFIGMHSVAGDRRGRDANALAAIEDWADKRGLDGMVWTDLPGNFVDKTGERFSVDAAIRYLKSLRGDDRERAFRYIRNAPAFIRTPLRMAFSDMLEGVEG